MTRWAPALAVPNEDQVRPGWLGFIVVVALGVVTYLLWRSMNTQLKRVDFEQGPGPDDDAKLSEPDASEPAGRLEVGGEPQPPPDAGPEPGTRR